MSVKKNEKKLKKINRMLKSKIIFYMYLIDAFMYLICKIIESINRIRRKNNR